jgi:hypothetical protein
MIAYVAAVVGVNIGFSYVPMIETVLGMFSPMAVIVGAIFVLRDFAQRRAGHFVLVAMFLAAILSYLLAAPQVAIASVLAFATSEIVDYFVYTLTKRPFRERVVISSLVSTPIDTFVFLTGIAGFSWSTFTLMIFSKMIAAGYIWAHYKLDPTAEPIIDTLGEEIDGMTVFERDMQEYWDNLGERGYPPAQGETITPWRRPDGTLAITPRDE